MEKFTIINRFWQYMEREESIKPIIFFRIALSLFAITKFAALYEHLEDVYGQYGYIQWAISKASMYDYLPHIGDIALLFGKIGIDASETLYILFWLYISLLAMLCCGLFTRIVSIACFYMHLMWIDTGIGFMYGVDVFTQISFFYLMFMPAGSAFSLDVFFNLTKSITVSSSAGLARKVLQIQMMIVYTTSGIEKGLGEQWRNGEAIWRSAMLPSFQQFDMSWLSHHFYFLLLSGWIVVLIETFYPVLMLMRYWRIIGVISVCMLHLFIGIFLGMWLFAFIMMIMSATAFGYEAWTDAYKLLHQRRIRVLMR